AAGAPPAVSGSQHVPLALVDSLGADPGRIAHHQVEASTDARRTECRLDAEHGGRRIAPKPRQLTADSRCLAGERGNALTNATIGTRGLPEEVGVWSAGLDVADECQVRL